MSRGVSIIDFRVTDVKVFRLSLTRNNGTCNRT